MDVFPDPNQPSNDGWLAKAGIDAPLLPAERLLLHTLTTGTVVDLRSTAGDRSGPVPVRAGLVRAIVRGLYIPASEMDPHGFQITGALIEDRLDLDDVIFTRPLALSHCTLKAGITAARATLHTLTLTLTSCTVTSPWREIPAIVLEEAHLNRGLNLTKSHITGKAAGGAVRLPGASIGGQLNCVGGTFTNTTGPALAADGLTTTSHVTLAGTFTGEGELGAVRLLGASIGGQLNCVGGTFTNTTGPALAADGLATTSHVYLEGTFKGHGELGAVRLPGASIGAQLNCVGGTFTNTTGPALYAANLTTTNNVNLAGTFTGHGEMGAVLLMGASIGAQLKCDDDGLINNRDVSQKGTFLNTKGPALHAANLTTANDVNLAGTFTGEGELGAVRLLGAIIGGQLKCEGGDFTNTTGPALYGDGITTDSHVYLTGTFDGDGIHGAIRLPGARIGGSLGCRLPGRIQSRSKGALNLRGARVEQDWVIELGVRAAGTDKRWLNIDGLTYRGLPQRTVGTTTWVTILANETAAYAAQPWQHLAAAHRATGHVEDATTLLIAQQEDRGKRIIKESESRYRVWLHQASKFFTRYGYKPSRTLVGLCIWAIIGVVFAVGVGQTFIDTATDPGEPPIVTSLLAHKPDGRGTPAKPPASCSLIEQIGLGLEWSVPILNTNASEACQLNTTHPMGQWLTAGTWILRLIGWALATIAIAGYTGIVKRL